jgi:formate dehydrogenase subunit gamma
MTEARAQAWNPELAEAIIARRLDEPGSCLPILHDLQDAFGCVPEAAVPMVARALNLSRAEVHGVVSFYHDFRHEPAGRRVVRLCRAEACQSMGGEAAARALLKALGLDWGQTTPDGAITVEPVYCLGLCAVAPAALIDGEPVGRLTGARLVEEVLVGGA